MELADDLALVFVALQVLPELPVALVQPVPQAKMVETVAKVPSVLVEQLALSEPLAPRGTRVRLGATASRASLVCLAGMV